MVRLKVEEPPHKLHRLDEFQFLMVRLKVIINAIVAGADKSFQFVMVRLKVILIASQPDLPMSFNSLWFD